MAQKHDPEDYKFWWPVFLLMTFLLGALPPFVVASPTGSTALMALSGMLILVISATLVAFRKLTANRYVSSFFVGLAFIAVLLIGSGVSGWLITLAR